MSEILQKTGENRIYFHSLDLLRALAAFLVVISHARSCLLSEFPPGSPVLVKTVYFVTNFGHEAVVIFFVLSGCVVGRIVLRGVQTGTWSWRDYLFDRLTRLWIVLIPALVLTAVWDQVTLAFSTPSSFVHTGNDFAHIFHSPLAAHISPLVFLGNVFYLQTICVPTFGSNNPLWSLANEFWYYLVFPLLLVGLAGRIGLARRILHLLGGFLILFLVGWRISSLFPIWLAGMAAFALFQKSPPRSSWIVPGLVLASGVTVTLLVLYRLEWLPNHIGGILMDNLLGLACAVLIYFALGVQPPELISRLGGFFSKFSYSVYLLHLPVVTCLAALFIGTNDRRLAPSNGSMLLLVSGIAGLYLYSYVVYLLTENKTKALRGWLKSRAGK